MRVLLATDRPELGHALSLFLTERLIHVVDVVPDAETVLEQTPASKPDAVVIDWRLGETASRRVVVGLMAGDEPTPVIILSSSRERARARAAGAAGYATLGDHPDRLIDALRVVEVGPARDADDVSG